MPVVTKLILGFSHEYPYFCVALGMLCLAGVCMLLLPRQRKFALLSGLLSMPYALFSFEFVGNYWYPKTIAFFISSPEDLMFSFSTGVIAWCLATAWFPNRIELLFDVRRLASCYLAYSLLGIGIGYAIKWTHPIGAMNAAMVSIALVGCIVAWLRRDLWRLAMVGGVAFAGFYLLVMVACAVLWPHFLQQWNSGERLGTDLFGLPTYELIWAAAYGLVWTWFMAHTFQATLTLAPAVVHSQAPRAHSSVD